tara:strand:- start:19582 stop:19962 length:381 start_codon:yes stop_codon:yes gene_type:complete
VTAHSQALRAYGQAQTPIRTARGLEYDVFARITHRLIATAKKGSKAAFPDIARAVFDNRQLWTLLASEVVDDANQLPAQLRAQIFYLSEFTQAHSRKVLKGEANVLPLIEVNSSIMRGLRSEGISK